MGNSFQYRIKSRPAVDFLEGLAVAGGFSGPYAATAMNQLYGLPAINSRMFTITALQVLAYDNFGPQLNFFSSQAGLTDVPGTDTYLGVFGFTKSMAYQINGTGLWRYYINGLDIPVWDADTFDSTTQGSLHVVMQNIDTVTAKTAGAPGAVEVTVWVNPMQAI